MEPYSLSLFDNPAPRDAELEEKRRKGKLTLVRPLSYVVIDIETRGLDVARSAIIEIGAVHVRNGAVSGRFQTFLTPEPYQSLSPFITNLTGITDSDLVGAPTFREILPRLRDFLGGYTLVGHNVNFDINFLYDRIYRETGEHLNNPYLDTKKLAKTVVPGLSHYSLEALCKHFGIAGNHHRAVDDCELTEKVLDALWRLKTQQG